MPTKTVVRRVRSWGRLLLAEQRLSRTALKLRAGAYDLAELSRDMHAHAEIAEDIADCYAGLYGDNPLDREAAVRATELWDKGALVLRLLAVAASAAHYDEPWEVDETDSRLRPLRKPLTSFAMAPTWAARVEALADLRSVAAGEFGPMAELFVGLVCEGIQSRLAWKQAGEVTGR